jgi:DNA replication protein DnaC
VIFFRPLGVGKTHLAMALAIKACQAWLSIYFTTMRDLIVKLKKDLEAGRSGKALSYYKSSLVIVDVVGYAPINREQCNLFFRFVANHYEKASTLITSNKDFSYWAELLCDPVIVTANSGSRAALWRCHQYQGQQLSTQSKGSKRCRKRLSENECVWHTFKRPLTPMSFCGEMAF